MLSLDLVTAAEEVADTKVTSVARCGGVGHVQRARGIGGDVGVGFGTVDHDVLLAVVSQRTAEVVASVNREDCTTVDGDGHVFRTAFTQDGVFGTAKERVDHDIVVVDGDGGPGNRRTDQVDGSAGVVGPNRVANGMFRCHGHHAGVIGDIVGAVVGSGLERGAVVGIIAVAAAVHRTDLDGGVGGAIGSVSVTSVNAQGGGGTVGSFHCSSDIVAAEHGADGVAVDDDHVGLAVDVGHTTAAEDGTIHQQTGFLAGAEGIGCEGASVAAGGYLVFIIGIVLQTGDGVGGDVADICLGPNSLTNLSPRHSVAVGGCHPRHGDAFVAHYGSGCLVGVFAGGLHEHGSGARLCEAVVIGDGERQGSRLVSRVVFANIIEGR